MGTQCRGESRQNPILAQGGMKSRDCMKNQKDSETEKGTIGLDGLQFA